MTTTTARPAAARCRSGGTPSSRRSCWRRWPASPTGRSASCAASTATRGSTQGGASGATSLYVSEMITSRALVERTPESMRLIEHDPDESPRSIQLYGVDPATVAAAVRMLVTEDRADHIDLNFGCPVPKVTRKGGGAALPWKRDLFEAIVRGAVREASPYDVPVTVKMRKGIDDDHLTYLEAGLTAERAGVAAVALHGRTAVAGLLGRGRLDRDRPAQGDREDHPGARQRRHLVGRGRRADDPARPGATASSSAAGCLGRPWLFTDLAAAFAGTPAPGRADARRGDRDDAPAHRVPHRLLRRRVQGLPRHPQAHRLVPQGIPGRLDGAPPARAGRLAGRARPPDRDDGRPTPPGRATPPRASAGEPARRAASRCPTAGSTAASSARRTARRSPRPSSPSPAADPGRLLDPVRNGEDPLRRAVARLARSQRPRWRGRHDEQGHEVADSPGRPRRRPAATSPTATT